MATGARGAPRLRHTAACLGVRSRTAPDHFRGPYMSPCALPCPNLWPWSVDAGQKGPRAPACCPCCSPLAHPCLLLDRGTRRDYNSPRPHWGAYEFTPRYCLRGRLIPPGPQRDVAQLMLGPSCASWVLIFSRLWSPGTPARTSLRLPSCTPSFLLLVEGCPRARPGPRAELWRFDLKPLRRTWFLRQGFLKRVSQPSSLGNS